MEAMAHGVPVVAPRAFGLPSMVRDGEGGVLFAPGDIPAATQAVERLLTDHDLLARLAAGARDHYDRRLSTSVRNQVLAPPTVGSPSPMGVPARGVVAERPTEPRRPILP